MIWYYLNMVSTREEFYLDQPLHVSRTNLPNICELSRIFCLHIK